MPERVYWCLHRLAQADLNQPLLTVDEEKAYKGFRFTARRRSWLAGRFAAKKLLTEVLDGGLPYDQIEIANDALGAPHVKVSGQNSDGCLSISHSDGWSAAAYAPAGLRIGIDLEAVVQRSEGFMQDYFTLAELAMLAHRGDPPDRMATLLWSAKESMLKAMGLGLRLDTRHVQVDAVGDEPLLNQVGWYLLTLSSKSSNDHWAGFWRNAGNFIITLAAILEDGSDVDLIQIE